jgi:hypothetical protein
MIAYHFAGPTLRDGRPIPADGEWLTHDGPITICETGLHASKCPWDALQYAPGATLCKVECDGIEAEQDDKFVCRRRKIIARFDSTEMLRAISRWAAKQVLHLWDAPLVVHAYLDTGDESLRAAAGAAARDAAWAAAGDAAGDAAWAAAGDAAGDAAWDAAWAAAGAAARDAARAAQKTKFAEMVNAKFSEMP